MKVHLVVLSILLLVSNVFSMKEVIETAQKVSPTSLPPSY